MELLVEVEEVADEEEEAGVEETEGVSDGAKVEEELLLPMLLAGGAEFCCCDGVEAAATGEDDNFGDEDGLAADVVVVESAARLSWSPALEQPSTEEDRGGRGAEETAGSSLERMGFCSDSERRVDEEDAEGEEAEMLLGCSDAGVDGEEPEAVVVLRKSLPPTGFSAASTAPCSASVAVAFNSCGSRLPEVGDRMLLSLMLPLLLFPPATKLSPPSPPSLFGRAPRWKMPASHTAISWL